MTSGPECIFCEIVAGKSPANIVWRWSDAVAFVPLTPVVDGHVLVIPIEHVDNAATWPSVTATTVQRAAEFAKRYDSFNIIISAGRAATQSVNHLHIHVVPRSVDDKLMTPWGTIYGDEPSAPHWCRVAEELSARLKNKENEATVEVCNSCLEEAGVPCTVKGPHDGIHHPCPAYDCSDFLGKTYCPDCKQYGEWRPATEADVDSLYAEAWGIPDPSPEP